MDDLFDEFLEYDFTMGSDVVICPHCGAEVSSSLFFDDELGCPQCGKKFRKEDAQ
jgi:DNA-directed RNA polymerase subunit RPC12/RpoP